MPTPFAHVWAAVAISPLFKNKSSFFKMLLLGMFCTVIPDADVLAFDFGIPYGHLFGHRGITHSIFFSALLGFLLVVVFYSSALKDKNVWIPLFCFFFLCAFSHAFFDAMTNGGKGVAMFAPFYNERVFLPFRPIKVAPFTLQGLMTDRGWQVLISEFKVVWIPCILLFFVFGIGKRLQKRESDV